MTEAQPAVWRVPGRIEVLGQHTDYAGGNVLVCAASQSVTATATPRPPPRTPLTTSGGSPNDRRGLLSARSSAFPGTVTLEANRPVDLPAGHWGRYVATAWHRLRANFGDLPDAHLTIDSDLPLASGMSSSSALVVASALALAD
ncbi:MAG: galactokinase family protein, partial [Mobilicoccus sp.]|nr:galactokinase family protein [Mobilicoccus sp.]